jgi:hypothetical protein
MNKLAIINKEHGFDFKILPPLGAGLALITILLSYFTALSEGHVKPFP